jgi:hypothetical protein
MANQLRDEFNKGTLLTPVSTRALVAFVKHAKQFGMDFATYTYVNSFEGDEERSAVRLVINTHRDNIAEELGLEVTNKASVFGNSNLEQAIANTEVGTQVASYEAVVSTTDPDITASQVMEVEFNNIINGNNPNLVANLIVEGN